MALLTVACVATGVGLAPSTQAASRWASLGTATIHPGVQMVTAGAQCTANFVYFEGEEVYLGYAAHCAGKGELTDLNGCAVDSQPLGTPVEIEGAAYPGTLAYSSWITMHARSEKNPVVCSHNDFAFVRIDPRDRGRVNPTVPHWGGPTNVASPALPSGTGLRAYGNSGLRQGLTVLSPMSGLSISNPGGGWAHEAYTLLPGIPGDSGMALMTDGGLAVGILSSITIAPDVGSLNFTDVGLAMYYAKHFGGFPKLLLARGASFNPNQLPLGI